MKTTQKKLVAMAILLCAALTLRAGDLYVPNFDFSLPDIGTNSPYAAPVLEDWQESPQAAYYDPANFGGSPWMDLAGTFYNLPDFTNAQGTNDTYIYNCDGVQAAFIFALPQVAIYQRIEAKYKSGQTYTLTVGLIGGGGDMTNGSTFDLVLYYPDGTNMVTVAATTVTNTIANFPTDTEFVDFQVEVPVQPGDPCVGKNIGIELLATPDPTNPYAWGGFWDVDNVRLSETTTLNLVNPSLTNGQIQFTLVSEPGAVLQILATTDLTLSPGDWTSLETVTNTSGSMPFMDESPVLNQRFYIVRPVP
jgi:hypothetical protein